MAEPNAHINYSAEDIERYLTGKMSAKEMHALEKAALQDPFLADAIEGLHNVSFEESQKHLNEINAALQNQKEETKVVALPSKSFSWWKIAAIIILIVGVGAISWFIVQSSETNEVKNLAQAKENKSLNADTIRRKETANAIVKNDTSKELFAQNVSPKSLKKENRKKDSKKNNDVELPQQTLPAQAFEINSDSLTTAKNLTVGIGVSRMQVQDSLQVKTPAPPVFEERKSILSNKAVSTFIGRVVDNNNQPVAYATISINNKQGVTTDTNGNFKLQFPDSLLNVDVSSVGFVTINTELKNHLVNIISIEPSKTTFGEVVTTGYGIKKSKKNTSGDSAYPVGGWESFQAYVYKKLNKPFDSTSNSIISGDVELEFLIDNNGEPYNFSVLKTTNDSSASKAIEVIKEGPKWITIGKEKKGKVTIRF